MDVQQLVKAAGRAASDGKWEEAEALWLEVRKAEPKHPQALLSLGIHAFQRGDLVSAERLLTEATEIAPQDPMIWHMLGSVLGRKGDLAGERRAIDGSLTADAYFLPGLLARANWLERTGARAAAATVYANALKVAPPEQYWRPELRPALLRAREVVAAKAEQLNARLLQVLEGLSSDMTPLENERWREAASIMSGRTEPYVSQSNQLAVPRLPSIPFFDRDQFPWARQIEAKTDVIRAELTNAMRAAEGQFQPYIRYAPGDPVNQWKDLNHSKRWSAFHLWNSGNPVTENQAACPETTKALQQVEMATIGGLCPNAMFSVLHPHTHIPPHNGETNARLVVHLPLIVPPGCTYRVGFERREWVEGQLLIFDDTIEHEARNDGDETRVVLIFDVWNPLLSAQEREAVTAFAQATRDFAATY